MACPNHSCLWKRYTSSASFCSTCQIKFGIKRVGPGKDVKGTATIEAKVQVELEETRGKVQRLQEMLEQQENQASTIREQMQVELNATRGRVQLLEDRLKQQEKQQLSTKGELLMAIQKEMKEVNNKIKSTTGNLQNAVKESEEKLEVVQRNIKKQCRLADQLQYSTAKTGLALT
ncbi:early endosome antigen 1-like [Haliotis rubra]|uniref:early endosome antigen 1-like n=1 Tax=Haliotis rubra TaxID=36100 RepID=UPI001EE5ACAE|nr:early endosome antigen 1-like [Haliotis rubra]